MRSAKQFTIVAVTVLIAALAVEAVSSAVIFRFYAHEQSSLRPKGSATVYLLRRALERSGLYATAPDTQLTLRSDDPRWMFRPDDVLGYVPIPGVYHIAQTNDGRRHDWLVTIQASGARATSYRAVTAAARLFVFGNSEIWGFGLDDELTAPWLLQTHLPGYRVLNAAVTGYSSVQQLLQYRSIRSGLGPDDIVFFSYDHWNMQTDIGSLDWLKTQSTGFEFSLSDQAAFSKVQIPLASVTDRGELTITRVPLICPEGNPNCHADIPRSGSPDNATAKIYDEIVHSCVCHVLVGFFEGSDDDPNIAHLRSIGVPIADLRIVKGAADDEDFLPEHSQDHRGAFTSYHYYSVILDTLMRTGMLKTAPAAAAK
jgi:hypothetical protein